MVATKGIFRKRVILLSIYVDIKRGSAGKQVFPPMIGIYSISPNPLLSYKDRWY